LTFTPLIPILQGTGVPNAGISTQVAASTGPQRSVRRIKGKGKETGKGEVKRKRTPKMALPSGINWHNTTEWFCAEMAKIYRDRPTGEVTKPEVAYAKSIQTIKEDLHFSVSSVFYCDRDHHLTNSLIW